MNLEINRQRYAPVDCFSQASTLAPDNQMYALNLKAARANESINDFQGLMLVSKQPEYFLRFEAHLLPSELALFTTLDSRTGVTDKAFDAAADEDLTIIGFARGRRFWVKLV